MHAREK
jgi:hypothetical protein